MKDYKFVGFWQRVVMYLFDLMILSGIIFLVSQILKVKYTTREDIGYLVFIAVRLSAIIPALYTLIFWKIKGATPGKIIRRVKIVDPKTGEIPKLWRLIVRYLCYPISKSLFFLGFIWIGLDSRKQAWHDKIAGTVVIKLNIMKIPKDADYYNTIQEIESLFPSSPANSDIKKWKFGKIFMVLSIISLLAFGWIFSDDRLLPEAESWLYESAFVENNPEDNGFYYLLGAFTPKDVDSFDIGYKWVQTQNDYILEYAKNSNIYDDTEWIDQLEMNINYLEMIDVFRSDSLLQYCIENKDSIIKNYTEYSYLNNRLTTVFEHKYFKNTLIPHIASKAPIFMSLVKFNLMKNIYITLLYSNGEKDKALNLLNQDIMYNRLLAEKADFLILKLFTTILLERNLKVYNHLLNIEKKESEELKKAIYNIQPISTSVRDMNKISKRMFIESVSTYVNLFNRHQNVYRYRNHHLTENVVRNSKSIIFKPHKTINREFFAKYYLTKLSRISGKEFIKYDKEVDFLKPSTLDYLNNMFGSILTSIAVPIYNRYVAKFHDIDGYINMLKLKVMIINQDISARQIPTFLEAQRDSLFNPYIEETIEWDAERSILHFEGPYEDDNKLREINIKL